jgi:hypothetical protein
VALLLALLAALLFALSLRLVSVASTLLAAYVGLVANLATVTWALSPLRAVTPNGLLVAEAALTLAAAAAWWLRGRPLVELAPLRTTLAALGRDPLTLLFLLAAGAALAYELLLALDVPPTNWDSLTYHLSRAAAWKQHDGIFWIPNAPTARMNEFQPLAEQEILFLFVSTGTTAVYALPQYLAELAILLAIAAAARRLGFGRQAAARSAALFAMFSLVALEATTAQNDLVSSSFTAVCACFLLGSGDTEALLAGLAAGLGVGAKLTTALAVPVLVWLAWLGGRRRLALALAGALTGLLSGGMWGFVLNAAQTGNPLGHGQGRTGNTVSPSLSGEVRSVAHLLDRLGDVSVLPLWATAGFAAAGAAAASLILLRSRPGTPRRQTLLRAAAVVLPLCAPLIALGVTHIPAGDPPWVGRSANEDYSAFGPIGMLALVVSPIAALVQVGRRDRRQLALALALPSYLILLALYAKYNIWITRFLIVPAVLSAPLFPRLFASRAASVALLAVSTLTVALTLTHDAAKPLQGAYGFSWQLDQAQAIAEGSAQPTDRLVGAAVVAYARLVPARACVGAVLDPDEPAFLLYGPSLSHHVVYLGSLAALQEAYASGLSYVVISTGANAPVAKQFSAADWTLKPLGGYWTLAVAPKRGAAASCS